MSAGARSCLLTAVCLLYAAAGWAQGRKGGRPEPTVSLLAAELKLSLRLRAPSKARAIARQRGPGYPALRLELALDSGPVTPVETTSRQSRASSSAVASVTAAPMSIDEPEQPTPFEAVKPGPSTLGVAAASSSGDRLPDFSLIDGWAMPPIRWGGNTSSLYNWTHNSEGPETFQNTDILNLRAASYIYQPWYAQVSGDVGLVMGDTTIKGQGLSQHSRSTTMNYGGNLSLFPQSRFPFAAYVQQSDSRAHMSNTGTHYTSSRFGLRQNYRPEAGAASYAGSYDRSDVVSGTQRSVVDMFVGTYAETIGDHRVGLNGQYSKTMGDAGGQGSELFNVNATHSWSEDRTLNVSSAANFMNNRLRTFSRSGLVDNDTQLIQLNNSFSWLPDEDLPITVNGGGNLLSLSNSTAEADTHLTNLQGYLNASYRVWDNLYATAAATASRIYSDGFSLFGTTQSAGLSYTGMSLVFGEYSYNWGGGASGNNQFVSSGTASRSVSAQAQHSLTRRVMLSETSTFLVNVGQSVSVSDGVQVGQNKTFTHSGGATWSQMLGGGSVGSLSATASDTVVAGDYASHYRNISINGNIQKPLTGRSTLTASTNFVLSQQLKVPETSRTSVFGASDNLDGSRTLSGSGMVTYSQRSPFDVQNLLYSASLMVNMTETNLRVVSGDPNSLPWQTGTVFQQNLDYRVGRLNFRGTAAVSRQNGKENASVFFMMNRDFGGL